MDTSEIITVLREFGIHKCSRSITTKKPSTADEVEKEISWIVFSGDIPAIVNSNETILTKMPILWFKTVNDLTATFDREIRVPYLTPQYVKTYFKSFLIDYMTCTRCVPFGFSNKDFEFWTHCSYHTQDFLRRQMQRIADFYTQQGELLHNPKVVALQDQWLHSDGSYSESQMLRAEIEKLASVFTQKQLILMEGDTCLM